MSEVNVVSENPAGCVLIIDDDSAIRSLLSLAMTQEGYQVEEASNGEEGINKYLRLRPDVILLDAMMPKMDGFTCCQRLRSLADGENTPILMITFLDDQESIEQAFLAGATDYITKPIHWEVLSQRVGRLIRANTALKSASRATEQLRQQQAWESLFSKITEQFCQFRPFMGILQETLTTLQILLQVERVIFFHRQGQLFQEVIAPGYASARSISIDILALEQAHRLNYLQGQAVAIPNLHESELPTETIALFTTIGTNSLLIAPLIERNQVEGILSAHSAQNPRLWDAVEVERFRTIANLLALGIVRSEILNAPSLKTS